MSLATRCSACGTVFRVVQDQLKVSHGWVRCGRCNEVFNGLQSLLDVDSGASVEAAVAVALDSSHAGQDAEPPISGPVAGDAPARDALPVQAAQATPDEPQAAAHGPHPALPPIEALDEAYRLQIGVGAMHQADPTEPASPHAAATVNAHAWPAQSASPGAPSADEALQGAALATAAADEPLASARADDAHAAPAADGSGAAATPSFVRQADRAARWQSKGVRLTLRVAAVALTLLLLLQLGVQQRDHIAAQWKGSKPWLDSLCAWAGCQVHALRRIDLLDVESSGLARIEGSPLYRLSMVLRSRAGTELMMPAVDLSLTDAQGQIIARRVLSVSELGHAAQVVAPGAELPLQAMLSTGSRRVAGYTIEVFYP